MTIRLMSKHSCQDNCDDDRSRRIEPALHSQENNMAAADNANQSLVVTAFWEVNPGEEAAVANLLKDFLPQAQRRSPIISKRRTSRTSSSGKRFRNLRSANGRSSASSRAKTFSSGELA